MPDEILDPFAPDRALQAHLTRPSAATRVWLLQRHQSSTGAGAIYRQEEGLKPTFWPHVLIRKTHEKSANAAGLVNPRFSRDRFAIVATVRSDKLQAGETPRMLLSGLHAAIGRDLLSFTGAQTQTGRISRPRIDNHACERSYAAQGMSDVIISELGFEVVFISS